MPKRKAASEAAPEPKTVGMPLFSEDLIALRVYRETEGRRRRDVPKEGTAAREVFRLGMEAWRAQNGVAT